MRILTMSRIVITAILGSVVILAVIVTYNTKSSVEGPLSHYEIGDAIREPIPTEENIFFWDMACIKDYPNTEVTKLQLTPRQACAIESAALNNPQAKVYLLHTCRVETWSVYLAPEHVKKMFSYPNVHVWYFDLLEFFSGSPLEEWLHEGHLKKSAYILNHSSDVLRLVTLWRYPGTYIDTDIVVMKSLKELRNYIGAQSEYKIANGFLNLQHDSIGNELIDKFMDEIRTNFKPTEWDANGPQMVTRVLQNICGVKKIRDMTKDRCQGFKILDPPTFYPVPWWKWKYYFNEETSKATLKIIEGSIAIHVWNAFSFAEKVTVGSKQPYGLIANKYCPKVYNNCGSEF